MGKDNFEGAMKKLEEIVHDLETGDLPLEESLKKFEEGVRLSQACFRKLDEAEKKIELLVKGEGGKLVARPFEPEGNV